MDKQLPGKVFNYLTLRTIIGVIALSLPFVVWGLANIVYPNVGIPTSISITYHLGARDIFVGSLFIVSAFLCSYNGFYSSDYPDTQRIQSALSKCAGISAAIVALFPTDCDEEWISDVIGKTADVCSSKPHLDFLPVGLIHTAAAVILFIILAIFCLYFFSIWNKRQRRQERTAGFSV